MPAVRLTRAIRLETVFGLALVVMPKCFWKDTRFVMEAMDPSSQPVSRISQISRSL
jgi:hypothetical protein